MTYDTPRLDEVGTVRDLTLGLGDWGNDDDSKWFPFTGPTS